jgi:hypothetical protein
MSASTSAPAFAAGPGQDLRALPVEHLFDMRVELEPAQLIATPAGLRATFVVRSGTLAGPRLRGEVVPGGGDWVRIGSDGVVHIDVRATLLLDDGTLIHLQNTGRVVLDDEQPARWANGQRVSASDAYARTCPRFETDPGGPHAWLNEAVCIAVNELAAGGIDYRVFRVT